MPSTPLQVGFIGLGNMGTKMVTNLARHGYRVRAYDKRPEAAESLASLGVRAARSIAELAGEVDVLCTCVLYEHQVSDIFLSDDGILRHARPGLITTIHSTIPPALVRSIADQAIAHEVAVIDAAVTLGDIGADPGALTLFVGGENEALDRAMPVLEGIARPVIRVGTAGMGQVVKMGNNIMSLGNQLLAMEAVKFVESFGVDKKAFLDAAAAGTGASWAARNFEYFDRYRDFHTLAGSPELPHRLGKDLRYIIETAQENWLYLPIVAICSQMLPRMFADRWYGETSVLARRRKDLAAPAEAARV